MRSFIPKDKSDIFDEFLSRPLFKVFRKQARVCMAYDKGGLIHFIRVFCSPIIYLPTGSNIFRNVYGVRKTSRIFC